MKLIKEISIYVMIIVVVVLIRTFIITPAIVQGESMVPTLKNGQVLILKKYDKKIERFDIVVIDYQDIRLVKRVIGFPGEHVKYFDNKLYINDKKYDEEFYNGETSDFDLETIGYNIIPDNYYFVMGDNRDNSQDSRIIGLIHIDDIIGSTNFSLFPFNRFGLINK